MLDIVLGTEVIPVNKTGMEERSTYVLIYLSDEGKSHYEVDN